MMPSTKVRRGVITVGETHRFNTAEGKLYVTVNWKPDTLQIVEVIPTIGKAGEIGAGNAQTIGKLISSLLKRGHPIDNLIVMLSNIRGGTPIWDGDKLIKSVPCAIGLAIEKVNNKLKSNRD